MVARQRGRCDKTRGGRILFASIAKVTLKILKLFSCPYPTGLVLIMNSLVFTVRPVDSAI